MKICHRLVFLVLKERLRSPLSTLLENTSMTNVHYRFLTGSEIVLRKFSVWVDLIFHPGQELLVVLKTLKPLL